LGTAIYKYFTGVVVKVGVFDGNTVFVDVEVFVLLADGVIVI